MWTRVQEELRRAVDLEAYEISLAPLELRELDGSTLVLAAPDERRTFVAGRFGRVLQACAAAVVGPQVVVEVIAASEPTPQGTPAQPRLDPDGRPELNPRLTFDQFVIGD